MSAHATGTRIAGPFGPAEFVESVPAAFVENMYREKCGASVDFSSIGVGELELYRCQATGIRFWRPERLAGDERFYQHLEERWPLYYRSWRWEYDPALGLLESHDRILEIGCGRGYFLRSTQDKVASGMGLELNSDAVADTVTSCEVRSLTVEELASRMPEAFDKVFSFQVLEHVVDPASFIASALTCLRPGGLLVLSTPDPENKALRERKEAFDLPPHHMSHISEDSYRRIAALHGLRIERFVRSPYLPWNVRAPGEPRPLSMKEAARIGLRNMAAKVVGRRGPTLMVVLRKPTRA